MDRVSRTGEKRAGGKEGEETGGMDTEEEGGGEGRRA